MVSFSKLVKSSGLMNVLFFISTFVAVSTLSWLGIHEGNSIKEIRHMVNSDFKEIELKIEKNSIADNQLLHTEVQSHLNNHIKNSQIILFGIIVSMIILGLTSFFTFNYFRRLKSIKLDEQLLDELLYYNQLNKIHATSSVNLPIAIKNLQSNRDMFFLELQQGLAKNQFVLYYQPIINVNTDSITDVEALIRWQHPVHGLLTPEIFLPLCETSGFITLLGEWVLQKACHQIKRWHDMGFSKLRMSINLSARQLNDDTLFNQIENILIKNNISPKYIKLEISENSLLKNVDASIKILKLLRQIGLELALDDFGTGYSSLNYLKQLPINNLKIDKSFIKDMTSNITSLGIVESVINLGKNLGLIITAEGVEENNQLHMLKKMKCDLVQGYLYSKPIPEDEFTRLLLVSEIPNKKSYGSLLNKNFCYEILSQQHYDQAVNVISHSFCEYEPMTKYLKITLQDFIPFAKVMVDKAIKDGLSIVALDNNEIAACTIVEDIADPLNITINLDSRFKIIFSLLKTLASEFFNERVLNKGQIAHLFITAVGKNYQGYGLSRKINFESIRLAKEKGFHFMCSEFTHEYNEKGTVKNIINNKLLIRTTNYKDFIFEGKKRFENLEGSANAYIWELKEGAQLRLSN